MAEMNNYEGLFIISPDLQEDDVKAVCKEIADSIAKHKGAITKEEDWGKRATAFPIAKKKEGYYYKLNFQAPPDSIQKLNGMYRLNTRILRVMTTRR